MARLTSPALGCLLRLVQVQVGQAIETYEAQDFRNSLELSLEGQRSLGSDCGILSLVIATGSKIMLSIRLSDMLNRSTTNDGIITIDKETSKLCVKLPTSDHVLRVWFRHDRDFLVSVCILRRSGFNIEDDFPMIGTTNPPMKRNIASKPMQCDVKLAPQASSGMQAAARTKHARGTHLESPSTQCSDTIAEKPGAEVFDEIITMLQRQNESSQPSAPPYLDNTQQPVEIEDLSFLNPYKVFSSKKRKNLNRPEISSPLRNILNQDQNDIQTAVSDKKSASQKQPKTNVRRHGYFTRSFSASNYQQSYDDATFDLSSSLNFRDMMPKRRRLPFLASQQMTSQPLQTTQTHQRRCKPKSLTMERNTACQPLQPDLTIILSEDFAFDKLDGALSDILDQYEKDLDTGCDAVHCAEFYLDRLQRERTKFWLEEMQKANFMEVRG